MTTWRAWVIVVTGLCFVALTDREPAVCAQDLPTQEEPIIKPPTEERPLHEARIDTERFEVGPYYGVYAPDGFGASGVLGARLAFHVTEDIAFEGSYAMTKVDQTAFSRVTGRPLLASDDLTYWSVGVSYDLFPGQIFLTRHRTINSTIYLVGGLGQTSLDDQNHFSADFGTGFKLFATDWLNIRPDFRLHLFETDVTGEKKLTYNLEGTIALALFF